MPRRKNSSLKRISNLKKKTTNEEIGGEVDKDEAKFEGIGYDDIEKSVDRREIKKCKTYSHKEPNISTGYDNRKTKSICGNFNQGLIDRYQFTAGKQCVPISLVAIIYTKIKDINTWDSSTLDTILDLGNDYYKYLQSLPSIKHNYILISELIKSVEIEEKCFHLDICEESQVGLLGSDNSDVGLPLLQSFEICLAIYEACFVTFGNNTFSVIKGDNSYYVFDSHARDRQGMVSPNGTSVLIEFNNITEVYKHCLNLSASMGCRDIEQYEITGINVCLMIDDDNNSNVDICGSSDLLQFDSDNLGNDISITGSEHSVFLFNPLNTDKKRLLCQRVGLPTPCNIPENNSEICKLSKPSNCASIIGDGNCFFRALSFVLTQTEHYHHTLRLQIIEHMRIRNDLFSGFLSDQYFSIDDYIKASRMSISGTWSSEVEIQAAANLLETDIYTYSGRRWLKYSPFDSDRSCDTGGIYLHHSNECHYEVVQNVQTRSLNVGNYLENKSSEFVSSNISLNICKERKRHKRGHNWTSSKKRNRYIHKHNIIDQNKVFKENRERKSIKERNEYNKSRRKRYSKYLKAKLKMKYETEWRYKLRRKYETQLQKKLKQRYESHLKERLKLKYESDLKKRLKLKYESDLKKRLKLKYESDFKSRLQMKYESDLKKRLKLLYQSKLRNKLRQKYKAGLKEKLKQYYQIVLKDMLVKKYKAVLVEKLKYKYSSDKTFKMKSILRGVQKYKSNDKYRAQLKKLNKKRRIYKVSIMSDVENAISQFENQNTEGPIYICCVCNRLLFKNQVKVCQEEIYGKKSKHVGSIAEKCISKTYYHCCNDGCSEDCKYSDNYKSLWICFTCDRKILKGKIPAECIVNNMDPGPIPPEISCLNQIERHLISKNILFLKLVKVSQFNDKKILGEAVCVPSNLTEMAKVLPRCENDNELIKIKLKRKLSYRGHYKFQSITRNHIKDALIYLKKYNKHYDDVIINREWIDEHDDMQETMGDNSTEGSGTVDIDYDKLENDSNSDSDLDLVDENIGKYTCDTMGSSCLQPVDISSDLLNNSDNIFSISPAAKNKPVRILMDDTNEACSFPYLFPNGKNTFSEKRDVRITLSKYLKNRLMSADTRFASCSDYLFYAQYISEVQQLLSSQSIALRQGRTGGKLITADMLTRNDPLQDILSNDIGFNYMKTCRGSPSYWQKTQKDLFAMIRQLGCPTFFVSFSCSELRWESFLHTILLQQGSNVKIDELNWEQKRELLRSNPVTVARLFDQRFKMFLRNVICKTNVLGNVEDYFFRYEIQARGAIHVHGIIYVKDSPKIDVDKDEEVVKFIDRYITCNLPSERDDPQLHEIVSNVQKHSSNHSKSCRKNKKTCRFNFPRPPSERTFICRQSDSEINVDSDTNKSSNMTADQAKLILESIWKEMTTPDKTYTSLSDLYNKLNINQELFEKACERLTKKTYVVLKRGINETWINQYNPYLLKAWNANLDIQFVTDAYACVVYIVSYITKAEKEMGSLLRETYKEAKRNNLDAKACMRKISTTYLHSREVSGPECALRVLGLPLKQFSRKVEFIPTGKNIVKITLPLQFLQSKAREGTLSDQNIFMSGIVDRYKCRPNNELFETMCIATFCSEYRLMSKSEKPNTGSKTNSAIQLQNDMGYIIKRSRSKPAIIRYARFSTTKDPENYYLSSLQLFLPYRIDDQLKPPRFETYKEFYTTGCVNIAGELIHVIDIVERNRSSFQTDIDIDSISEVIDKCGELEDAWANIAPETEQDRLESDQFREENKESDEDEDKAPQIPDFMPAKDDSRNICREKQNFGISSSEAIKLLRCLNTIQSRVFYKVRQFCLDKTNNKNPDPLRLFITGSAGTGKSHVIKCIHYEASRILAKSAENLDDVSVLLTAPTGVSAFNIGAGTIHSSFSIRKNFGMPYQPIGQEALNTMRCKYRNLHILIIDEISMVDHKLLCYIHGRLCQIKGTSTDQLFGGVSLICFGDFWQLRPVKASGLCHDSVVDIWNGNFKIVELTEIMRQKDDLKFAQVLNRIRKRKKSEKMLASDIELLQSRVTGVEDDCLHIYSTNAQVDAYNSKMIAQICDEVICIHALDYSKDARSGKMILKEQCIRTADTPLIQELKIGIGSKVMLVVNLDVSMGLTNGSFGTVTYIENNNDGPTKVYVKFDSARLINQTSPLPSNVPKGSFAIERYESAHINYKGDVRHQFPLRLAYAVTIHKVQGLSLERGVISLDKIFQAGQAYVALSRVKTLEGLTIENFNEKAIYCDERIESAVNDMPKFLENEQSIIPTDTNIVLFNVQGLTSHIEDIKNDARIMNSADIICVTETWLNHITNPSKIRLKDYIFHNQSRNDSYDESNEYRNIKDKEHGGVGFYHKKNVLCNVLRSGIRNLEYIAFAIPEKKINIVVIYRSPSYRLELFIPQLNNLLYELEQSGCNFIVMGDFNQNILEGSNSIEKCFNGFGYTQCVKDFTTEGGTLIDHVYVSAGINSSNVKITIIPTYYGYHEALRISFDL